MATLKDHGGWGLKKFLLFNKSLIARTMWLFLTNDSIWKQILLAKYIYPLSLIDWIRRSDKSCRIASNHWKALLKAFHVIEPYLPWKVGNGNLVWVGRDSILGLPGGVRLSSELKVLLHDRGFHMLDQFCCDRGSSVWQQNWISGDFLG